MTYNHAPYITEALDGITMQETQFPFVCIVCDDASTDGTGKVIMDYYNEHFKCADDYSFKEETEDYVLYHAQHNTNKNCYFSVYLLKYNHFERKEKVQYFKRWIDQCKYIAICEGDDYWVIPTKLQKQYDFMETHQEYGMCFTDFNMRYGTSLRERTDLIKNEPNTFKSEYSLSDWLVEKGYVGPMTWLVRTPLWNSIPSVKTPDGTFVFFAWFLYNSKVFCLKELTSATYRVLEKSASHSNDVSEIYEKRIVGMYDIQCLLIQMFYPQSQERERLQRVIDEQFYKIGLRWFVALGKEDKIRAAKTFNYEHASCIWRIQMKLAGCLFFKSIWTVMFKPFLQIRRKWVRVRELKGTRIINKI